MVFPVCFSNTNLPKRLNLLRSKGDFVGKSGRSTTNSIQTCVQGGLPRRRGAHTAEPGPWFVACGPSLPESALGTPTERNRVTGERRSRRAIDDGEQLPTRLLNAASCSSKFHRIGTKGYLVSPVQGKRGIQRSTAAIHRCEHDKEHRSFSRNDHSPWFECVLLAYDCC